MVSFCLEKGCSAITIKEPFCWHSLVEALMVIEKLVQFERPHNKIFLKFEQAWQEQGFDLVDSQEKE